MRNIAAPLFIVMALLAFDFLAQAQTQFQTVAGTPSNDRNYHLTSTRGGGLLAAGYTEAVPGNLTDALLVKYNAFGQVQWTQTYGGTGNETTWDIITTKNSNIIGAGYSSSLGTPFEAATITRADSNGNVIWLTGVYHQGGNVNFYRVMETNSGHLIATGLATSNNQDDIVVCKFDAMGNLLWSKIAGTPQADEVMGMIETAEGHYLFAGLTADAGGAGGDDFAVLKTDTAGNVIWMKRYGGAGSDRLNSVVEAGGAYYFLGWSAAGGIGGNDFVVMRTDTAGNLTWANAYGTPQTERAFNMLYNPASNTLIAAGYTDYSDSATNNRNTALLSLDMNGTMNWARSYGSTSTDGHWPTGLATTSDEGYYLLGSTNSMGPGSYSFYLIKTDAEGNSACNQKEPNFNQSAITGWAGAPFGTSSAITLTSVTLPVTGVSLPMTTNSLCCNLFINAGADTTLCPGDTISLGSGGIPGYAYFWTSAGRPVGATPLIDVGYGEGGRYSLQVSAPGSNCAVDSQAVLVEDIANPISLGNDTAICAGDTVLLHAPIPYTHIWLHDPGNTNKTIEVTTSGTYSLQVDRDRCVFLDSVLVDVNPVPPVPSISVSGNDLSSSVAADGYQWYLDGNPIPGADQQTHSASQTGNHHVVITNAFGCSSSSAVINHWMVGMDKDHSKVSISMMPNPATDWLQVAISGLSGTVQLSLIDNTGRLVYHQQIQASETGFVHKIDLGSVPAGLYHLSVGAGQVKAGFHVSVVR